MPEYIERDMFLKIISRKPSFPTTDREDRLINYCISAVKNFPAADVRPVVLCRNCKYCIKEDEFEYWCNGFCSLARLVREDDYCSHGAEREEG